MKALGFALTLMMLTAVPALAAAGDPMTNQDVVSMVQGKVAQDVIVTAIQNAKPNFDTSAAGLIALSNAGVPAPVVQAMIEAGKAPAAATPAPAPFALRIPPYNPDDALMIANGDTRPLQYGTPGKRTAARALGFGGLVQYAILKGDHSLNRVKSGQPAFLVVISNNTKAEDSVVLVGLDVRKDDTREVPTGRGYFTFKSGFAADHVRETVLEKAEDQSRAPTGYTVYKVTAKQPLSHGEYALVLDGLYYEFGVD